MCSLIKLDIDVEKDGKNVDCYLDKETNTIHLKRNFNELTSSVGPDDYLRNTSVIISQKVSLEDFIKIVLKKEIPSGEVDGKTLKDLLSIDNKIVKYLKDKL